jgi:hypothetical protein
MEDGESRPAAAVTGFSDRSDPGRRQSSGIVHAPARKLPFEVADIGPVGTPKGALEPPMLNGLQAPAAALTASGWVSANAGSAMQRSSTACTEA